MDLGAMICSANGTPRCAACPLAALCEAKKQQLTWLLPIKKAKKPRQIEPHTIVILNCGTQVWIHKRPQRGLLAGLWEFLDLPGTLDRDALAIHLKNLNITPDSLTDLGRAKHLFTHREWHMQGWLVQLAAPAPLAEGLWVETSALQETYAMAGALSPYRSQLFKELL